MDQQNLADPIGLVGSEPGGATRWRFDAGTH
jgi:hypothetical protein